MGVDLTIIKAKGFLFPAHPLPPANVLDNLYKRSGLRPSKDSAPSDKSGAKAFKRQKTSQGSCEEIEADKITSGAKKSLKEKDEQDGQDDGGWEAESDADMKSESEEKSDAEQDDSACKHGYRTKTGVLEVFIQEVGAAPGFKPYGLLVPPCNKVEYLFEEKVGLTPFSFIATGVYCGHERVKGGANIPFVVQSYADESKDIKKPKDFDEYKALFKGTGLTEETLQWLAENVQEYSLNLSNKSEIIPILNELAMYQRWLVNGLCYSG
ncbi:hypothetical protein KFL_001270130 [Klebsormidium nitens]|uniref:Uncharacterized protein n=1 Tax=Klebsormidium nitens TaxID=105231 RepID=A0A1Y1HW49_KLENI|nr:hypothetical protein KFL_001270130 [Klebsormidium nitens]|eukprot:GAQ82870.1 hypothetical protein KFL_001270130 [Klebsormidium nitens]